MFEHQEAIPLGEAIKAFSEILDAIPRAKKANVFQAAQALEVSLKQHARLLAFIRGFWDEQMGGAEKADELDLVKLINQLVPR